MRTLLAGVGCCALMLTAGELSAQTESVDSLVAAQQEPQLSGSARPARLEQAEEAAPHIAAGNEEPASRLPGALVCLALSIIGSIFVICSVVVSRGRTRRRASPFLFGAMRPQRPNLP